MAGLLVVLEGKTKVVLNSKGTYTKCILKQKTDITPNMRKKNSMKPPLALFSTFYFGLKALD